MLIIFKIIDIFTIQEGSECSSVTSESMPGGAQTTSPPSSTTHPQNIANTPNVEMLYAELRVRKHESERLREQLESMKVCYQYKYLKNTIIFQ